MFSFFIFSSKIQIVCLFSIIFHFFLVRFSFSCSFFIFSFSFFCRGSKSDFFGDLNFVTVSQTLCLKEINFGSRLGGYAFEASFSLFFFFCRRFSLFFFLFLFLFFLFLRFSSFHFHPIWIRSISSTREVEHVVGYLGGWGVCKSATQRARRTPPLTLNLKTEGSYSAQNGAHATCERPHRQGPRHWTTSSHSDNRFGSGPTSGQSRLVAFYPLCAQKEGYPKPEEIQCERHPQG